MATWTEIRTGAWVAPVDVGSQAAIARIERESASTWVVRVSWDGWVHMIIGGYVSVAQAQRAVTEGVLKAMVERSKGPPSPAEPSGVEEPTSAVAKES